MLYEWAHRKAIDFKLRKINHICYSADWTSCHIPNWEKWFENYINKENVNFLEIGSYEGRSAIWFLDNVLTHPTAKLTLVDIMPPKSGQYLRHNLGVSGSLNKVTFLKGRSEDILPSLEEESFDVIYVDGSHRCINVLADTIYSWQLLKLDGLLLIDDYLLNSTSPKHVSSKYAVDLFLKHFCVEYELLHTGYQVLLRKVV